MWRTDFQFRLVAPCAIFFVLLAQQVQSHSLVVFQGKVRINQDAIIVSVSIDDHDVRHHFNIGTIPLTRRKAALAKSILDGLQIYDQRGYRIEALSLAEKTDSMRYALNNRTEFVALRWTGSAGGHFDRARLVLDVADEHAEPRRLTLTNRGNVALLQLGSGKSPLLNPKCEHLPRSMTTKLNEIHTDWHLDEHETRIDVYIPAKVLEMWLPIVRETEATISTSELADSESSILSFVKDKIILRLNEEHLEPSNAVVSMLSYDGFNSLDIDQCFWASMIKVSLGFESSAAIHDAALTWGLFNGAVLSASVHVASKNVCRLERVSTYESAIHWAQE